MSSTLPGERIISVNQLIREIIQSNRNGSRFCFILGSGASVESGIPTGSELEKRWMNFIMGETDDGSGIKNDPKESRELAERLKTAKKLNYSFSSMEKNWRECKKDPNKRMSSKYYFDIYKLRFHPDKINGYRYMERVMEHCAPSIGYHPLSLLLSRNNMNNLVITTNFDSLMEDALSIYSDKKPLIVGHESLTGFINTEVQRPIIAKVHRGLFYDPFNTPETTDHLSDEWKKALQTALNIYTPIVIGYGGGDGSLMAFLEEKDTVMRHGIYWCYRENEDPDERIRKLVEDKDGYFVPIKGFDALMLEMGKQILDGAIHPASVEQYLKKQTEERIKQYNEQWTELNKKPELETIVESINQSEQKKEEKRETEGTLTYWDRIRRGSAAYERKDYKTAVEEFSEANRMQTDDKTAYVWLGATYYDMKKYDEAFRDYGKAIELDPDYAEGYAGCGIVYNATGRYDEAIAEYTRAIELKPDYKVAYINRGNSYSNKKKYDEALGDFNKVIELDPNYAEAYTGRGNVYDALGRYDEAIREYTRSIELKPDYKIAFNNRGGVYYNKKKYDEALRDYNKAIELDPNYAEAYSGRGIVYSATGKYDEAIVEHTRAIELSPNFIKAYNNRGSVYYKMKKYDDALRDYNKAIELDADYITAYDNRAKAYRCLGKNDLAEKDEEMARILKEKRT